MNDPEDFADFNSCVLKLENLLYITYFYRYGYLKKIIEEVNAQEDTKKLLQFCSWENPTFSHAVLYELLWQVAIAYTYELRPYLDLLLNILLMEDSWQLIRIKKTLKGIPDEHTAREGLFTFTDHRWRSCFINIFLHIHFAYTAG